jgi:hypothetical protein
MGIAMETPRQQEMMMQLNLKLEHHLQQENPKLEHDPLILDNLLD